MEIADLSDHKIKVFIPCTTGDDSGESLDDDDKELLEELKEGSEIRLSGGKLMLFGN